MSNINEAAKKAINLGKQLKAVIDIGEFLEGIIGLEQTATEAENRASIAMKQAQVDTDKAAIQRRELVHIQEKVRAAEEKLSTKEKGVQEVFDAAQIDAENMLVAARTEYNRVVSDAVRKVAATNLVAERTVRELEKKQDELREEIAADNKTLASLRVDYDKLKGRFS